MKRYLFTLLLAGLAMFTACTDDRDSNPTVQQPSTFELNMPALGGGVYDLANTDSIIRLPSSIMRRFLSPVPGMTPLLQKRMTLHISKWTALSQYVSLVRRLIW